MLIDHIDTSRLANDIRHLIADCTYLKSLLRRRWERPMAEEQRRLVRVRRQLTERFVLLALLKKRIHVAHPPAELRDQPRFDPATWDALAHARAIARRLLPDYATAGTMEVSP
jgi:hypothetical protein